jgi:hypothetical protein
MKFLLPTLIIGITALSPYPLQGIVDSTIELSSYLPLVNGTGLLRSDYLPVIHGIVSFFVQYQNANGSIIDPYEHREIQYSTPCFSFASATVATSGYDPSFMEPAMLALDISLYELANVQCADGHCNFYTYPIMMSYKLLAPYANQSRLQRWQDLINAIDPTRAYINLGGNWGLLASVSEYLRVVIDGFGQANQTRANWWQGILSTQLELGLITDTGNYCDHSGENGLNPLPYDTFPDKYLTVFWREGYNGYWAPQVGELMRRASLSHLLMQSPWGEILTGGRSSQHQWNEAASSVVYELYASFFKEQNLLNIACMFKRAAHLSLQSVKRWQNADGSLQIIKNHFDPALRYGYEEYSYLTNYNNLPASQLATAYYYADAADSIPECLTFTDIGGFVFALSEMNKIVANSGGFYLEFETNADSHYDSTGLTRIHVNNCGGNVDCIALPTLLGPTAAPPQQNTGISLGVWWNLPSDAPDAPPRRLGNYTYLNTTSVLLTPYFNNTKDYVAFAIQYVFLDDGVLVQESYEMFADSHIAVESSVTVVGSQALKIWLEQKNLSKGRKLHTLPETKLNVKSIPKVASDSDASLISKFGVTFPASLTDGRDNTTITLGVFQNQALNASVTVAGWGVEQLYTASAPSGHSLAWLNSDVTSISPVTTRNGLLVPLDVAILPINTNSPSISYTITPRLN